MNLTLPSVKSMWAPWRCSSPSAGSALALIPFLNSRDAQTVDSATRPNVPLSSGIDAERFARHYAEALADRKVRLKQRLANAMYFYIAPIALGMLPGKLLADHYFRFKDGAEWAFMVYGTALLITPALMRYRRVKHACRAYRQFYLAAIEKCIADEQP